MLKLTQNLCYKDTKVNQHAFIFGEEDFLKFNFFKTILGSQQDWT